ncbi:MAG: SIMPL domain-containing protein [Halobacteriales archaeon]|nr:SIMPL domain-containing protein [Halobacteriales archaeon]
MHPRRKLIVIGTISIVLLASLAAVGPAGGQEMGAAGNVSITVGADGAVSAPPDVAVIHLAIEASAGSAESAGDFVANNTSEVRSALSEMNVSGEQVRTTFFVIDSEKSENGSVTYRAVHGLEVRVSVEEAGEIVDAVTTVGATRIDGVEFTLTDETRRELRDDALRAAMSNARADADVIADANDIEIDAVVSVETSDSWDGPFVAELRQGAGTTFDPGPVTVTATVTVTYHAS